MDERRVLVRESEKGSLTKGDQSRNPREAMSWAARMSGEGASTWHVPRTAEASHVRHLTESSCPLR